eukprot:1346276-Amorphochlora_amoeboformis.AAC.1
MVTKLSPQRGIRQRTRWKFSASSDHISKSSPDFSRKSRRTSWGFKSFSRLSRNSRSRSSKRLKAGVRSDVLNPMLADEEQGSGSDSNFNSDSNGYTGAPT